MSGGQLCAARSIAGGDPWEAPLGREATTDQRNAAVIAVDLYGRSVSAT